MKLNISMKRFLYTSIIVIASLMFTSCDLINFFVDWNPNVPDPNDHTKPGFICDYYHIDEDIIINSEITGNSLAISFSAYQPSKVVNRFLYIEGENAADYMEKYGDPTRLYEEIDIDYSDMACAESIRSIDIIPLNNWDEEHPSLEGLNELFEVEYATYKYFVESGFNCEEFDIENRERIERKRVTELAEDDMWFINTDFKLICTTLPDFDDSAMQLRIKIYLDTDKELQFDVAIN